jgi:hypothetical protein
MDHAVNDPVSNRIPAVVMLVALPLAAAFQAQE